VNGKGIRAVGEDEREGREAKRKRGVRGFNRGNKRAVFGQGPYG